MKVKKCEGEASVSVRSVYDCSFRLLCEFLGAFTSRQELLASPVKLPKHESQENKLLRLNLSKLSCPNPDTFFVLQLCRSGGVGVRLHGV